MKDRIQKLIEIDWLNDLHDLQPENIKLPYNYEQLKKSLLKHGFAFPFAVWNDGEKYYAIDGHTRKTILTELKSEGQQIPDKLKAFVIDAKDKKEAISILLDVYNSKSNPLAEEILLEWLDVEDIDKMDIEMDSINLSFDNQNEIDYSERNSEIDVDEYTDSMIIKLNYTEDEYRTVKDALLSIGKTPESAVWNLLIDKGLISE